MEQPQGGGNCSCRDQALHRPAIDAIWVRTKPRSRWQAHSAGPAFPAGAPQARSHATWLAQRAVHLTVPTRQTPQVVFPQPETLNLSLRGQKPSCPAGAFAAFDSVPCLAERCGHFANLRSHRQPAMIAGLEAVLQTDSARQRRQTPRSVAPSRLDQGLPLDFPSTPREPKTLLARSYLTLQPEYQRRPETPRPAFAHPHPPAARQKFGIFVLATKLRLTIF